MELQGSASWRFEQDDGGFLDLALFVRDAAGLPVAPAATIPPRLAGALPELSGAVPAAERATAARQWALWWQRLLDSTARGAQRRVQAQAAGILDLELVRQATDEVIDPPEFGSLTDLPQLRSAVMATFEDAVAWSASQRAPAVGEAFPWALVRDAVEHTAAERSIPLGDLDATAHVLGVTGSWSWLPGPGCAVCSVAVATEPSAAGRLLRELFGSVGPRSR